MILCLASLSAHHNLGSCQQLEGFCCCFVLRAQGKSIEGPAHSRNDVMHMPVWAQVLEGVWGNEGVSDPDFPEALSHCCISPLFHRLRSSSALWDALNPASLCAVLYPPELLLLILRKDITLAAGLHLSVHSGLIYTESWVIPALKPEEGFAIGTKDLSLTSRSDPELDLPNHLFRKKPKC